tara:strand:- start:1002 stop:2099 length:1098 start_codon:yes stop_codon:yes gene_type:complete
MYQKIINNDIHHHFASLAKKIKPTNAIIFTSDGNLKRKYQSIFVDILNKIGTNVEILTINDYPDLHYVGNVLDIKRSRSDNLVISIGGGSAIDIAKVYSACESDNDNPIKDFSEIKLTKDKKIFNIAIPTTAGSGAESTKFATIWDRKNNKKFSFENKLLIPEVVYLYSDFLVSLPKELTLTTSLDSLCHAIDSLWNKNKTPESIALSIEALNLIIKYLPMVMKDLQNKDIREELLKASNLSGQAINISRTSLNHSISYPLTNMYRVPHGLACAFSIISTHRKYKDEINNILGGDLINKSVELLCNLDLELAFRKIDQFDELFDVNMVTKNVLKNSRISNFQFEINTNDLGELLENSYDLYLSSK